MLSVVSKLLIVSMIPRFAVSSALFGCCAHRKALPGLQGRRGGDGHSLATFLLKGGLVGPSEMAPFGHCFVVFKNENNTMKVKGLHQPFSRWIILREMF